MVWRIFKWRLPLVTNVISRNPLFPLFWSRVPVTQCFRSLPGLFPALELQHDKWAMWKVRLWWLRRKRKQLPNTSTVWGHVLKRWRRYTYILLLYLSVFLFLKNNVDKICYFISPWKGSTYRRVFVSLHRQYFISLVFNYTREKRCNMRGYVKFKVR